MTDTAESLTHPAYGRLRPVTETASVLLADNPGLQPRIGEAIARGYRKGRIEAARETGLDEDEFPETCPYSFDDLVSRDFVL